MEIVSPGFPSVRPCQVTIEDFFSINIWVFSVWY